MHIITRRVATFGAAATLSLTGLGAVSADAVTPTGSTEEPAVVAAAKTVTEQAERRGCRVPYCYGAISVAWGDAAAGYYYNAPTRSRAVRLAHRRCKQESNRPRTCRKMGSTGNGCQAVAIRWNGRQVTAWKVGFGRSLKQAKRRAMRKLNGRGRHLVAYCTSRRY